MWRVELRTEEILYFFNHRNDWPRVTTERMMKERPVRFNISAVTMKRTVFCDVLSVVTMKRTVFCDV